MLIVNGCSSTEIPEDQYAQCQKENSQQFVYYGENVPLPPNTGIQLSECNVKSITIIGSGSQPDWSEDGNLIAFTDEINGNYEVWIMNTDGSNRHCLTCNGNIPPEFINKNKGKPTFYPPDSRYLLFGVENEHGDHGLNTQPGIGENYDLWITDLETQEYWRLTNLPDDSALQYPCFSSDGTELLWSQRFEKEESAAIWNYGCEYGFWKLQLADFSLVQTTPKLGDIIGLEPAGTGYYEPHGFLPGDNTKIIISAQTNPEKSAFYCDIYTYDLTKQKLTELVSTDDIHYEMATYSPNGKKIAYMAGPFIGFARGPHKTDLYLMDADGQNRIRLTYFNQPGNQDYIGATCQIQKIAWSPDGTQLISAYYNHETKESTLFKIDFHGYCGQ